MLRFEDGRRDVIWTLEGTALYPDLFKQSARLLLKLADAENETWSNNATGVFTGLFSLGYSNFFSGGWSGPSSEHYAGELAKLNKLREGETDPNALRWLKEAIEATQDHVENAKIDEEARGY